MATQSEGEKLQGLTCPMCLEVLTDATLLGCGHSFCKGCLEAYDEQHKDLNHIVCPVCRKSTPLDQQRVAGLTPNFLAKGLEDILQLDAQSREDDPSSKFCEVHGHIYKDILCQACGNFICLNCYIDCHQGHKIKKKEELEREFKAKRDALLQKCKTRKAHIEKCLTNAEQQRQIMNNHLSNLEREVRVVFAKKVATLQENEGKLLEKIESIRKDLDKQLESCISRCMKVIDRITNSVNLFTHHASKSVDPDMINTDHLRCIDLEDSLVEAIDEESTTHVQEMTESVQFCPADVELIALGYINVGDKDIGSDSQNVTDDACACGKAGVLPAGSVKTESKAQNVQSTRGRRRRKNRRGRKQQASRNALGFPEVHMQNNSLTIVRARGFPLKEGRLFGLAALSENAVVLGYAMDRKGCDFFTVLGLESEYLGSEVGDVYDIAFLSGGRTVISKSGYEFFVYDTHSANRSGMRYTCSSEDGGYVRVCSDQHDNIYAVNINSEIYIFHGSNPNPQRVVPTGDIQPKQICVTRTGVMITTTGDITPSTVTVFDREGLEGTCSSIMATHDCEFVYATVDSQDRVLVATIENGSDMMRLTRYLLQGNRLVEQVKFQPVQLSYPLMSSMFLSSLFYIVSLTPYMVAVATRHHLYFIQLGM